MENDILEIDVMGILELIWNNIVTIIIISLIFGVCSFVFTKTCIPKQYTSSVSMYVMNNKVTQNTGEILSSDISASQMLVNTYAVILSDNLVMEDIGKQLIAKRGVEQVSQVFPVEKTEDGNYIVPPKAISRCLNLGAVNSTEVMKVTATTTDPQLSVDLCLAMNEVAPKVLSQVMGVAYVNPIGYPELPTNSSYPNAPKNATIGVLLGFILSAGFFVLSNILDNSITDGESLRKKFDLPVLGEIPYYNFDEAGGTNNV